MPDGIIDAEKMNECLKEVKRVRPKVEEVLNPAYVKRERERRTFMPGKSSIVQAPGGGMQPSLAEQMRDREQVYETDVLMKVRDICEYCPDYGDCTFADEMQAADRCVRVKRNLVYYGVVVEKK